MTDWLNNSNIASFFCTIWYLLPALVCIKCITSFHRRQILSPGNAEKVFLVVVDVIGTLKVKWSNLCSKGNMQCNCNLSGYMIHVTLLPSTTIVLHYFKCSLDMLVSNRFHWMYCVNMVSVCFTLLFFFMPSNAYS